MLGEDLKITKYHVQTQMQEIIDAMNSEVQPTENLQWNIWFKHASLCLLLFKYPLFSELSI